MPFITGLAEGYSRGRDLADRKQQRKIEADERERQHGRQDTSDKLALKADARADAAEGRAQESHKMKMESQEQAMDLEMAQATVAIWENINKMEPGVKNVIPAGAADVFEQQFPYHFPEGSNITGVMKADDGGAWFDFTIPVPGGGEGERVTRQVYMVNRNAQESLTTVVVAEGKPYEVTTDPTTGKVKGVYDIHGKKRVDPSEAPTDLYRKLSGEEVTEEGGDGKTEKPSSGMWYDGMREGDIKRIEDPINNNLWVWLTANLETYMDRQHWYGTTTADVDKEAQKMMREYYTYTGPLGIHPAIASQIIKDNVQNKLGVGAAETALNAKGYVPRGPTPPADPGARVVSPVSASGAPITSSPIYEILDDAGRQLYNDYARKIAVGTATREEAMAAIRKYAIDNGLVPGGTK